MAFRRTNTKAAEGQWATYGKDPETGEPVRFFVRAVPASVDRELMKRHLGKSGERADLDHSPEYVIAIATYAAVKSEGFSGEVVEARKWSKLLGREVAAGEVIEFDQVFATNEAAREQALRDSWELTDLPLWVQRVSTALRVQGTKEEEALGKI